MIKDIVYYGVCVSVFCVACILGRRIKFSKARYCVFMLLASGVLMLLCRLVLGLMMIFGILVVRVILHQPISSMIIANVSTAAMYGFALLISVLDGVSIGGLTRFAGLLEDLQRQEET